MKVAIWVGTLTLAVCSVVGFWFAGQSVLEAQRFVASAQRLVDSSSVSTQLGPAANPVSSAQLERASRWFQERGLDLQTFRNLPIKERAKAANFLAYKFCETDSIVATDLLSLYDTCKTQCGGYTYVMMGIAEALGIKSRLVNFYNIPQQGNHTAAELAIDDDGWAFFDPTFGAYFTDTGKPDGRLLSVREITSAREGELAKHVLQADERFEFSSALTTDVYTAKFEHQYMDIENYRRVESVSEDDPNELVALRVRLDVSKGPASVGDMQSDDRAVLGVAWLKYTNGTLNDDIEGNDTSYASNQLLNTRTRKQTVLNVVGTQPGKDYSVRIRVFNPASSPQELQIVPLGLQTRLKSERTQTMLPGASFAMADFRAEENRASLVLRNMGAGLLELYAYEVTPSGLASLSQ